jgi:hypothetical protein
MSKNFNNIINRHINKTAAITRLDPTLLQVEDMESTSPFSESGLTSEEESIWNDISTYLYGAVGLGAIAAWLKYASPECRRSLLKLKEKLTDWLIYLNSGDSGMASSAAIDSVREILKSLPQSCRNKALRDKGIRSLLETYARGAGVTVEEFVNKFIEANDEAALHWLKSLGIASCTLIAVHIWAKNNGYGPDTTWELGKWASVNQAAIIAVIISMGLAVLISGLLSGGESPIALPGGVAIATLVAFLIWFNSGPQPTSQQS